MSRVGKTLVKGHALRLEGQPFHAHGDLVTHSWEGHALCECGWLSDSLPSNAARKRAHARHKLDVKLAQIETSDGSTVHEGSVTPADVA